jgi:PAS domain S-box-containing protein
MDNSPAVGFMKDEEGRFVYANQRFEGLFQRRLDEVLGKTDFELWPEEVARRLRENDRHVFTTGQGVEVLETVPTPDGVERHWMVFKFPVRAESGRKILGGVAIDVTARRQAEEALRRRTRSSRAGSPSSSAGPVRSRCSPRWRTCSSPASGPRRRTR